MIQFDKNIPITKKRGRGKNDSSMRAIIQRMEVGDSYLFENRKVHTVGTVINRYCGGTKYVSRTVDGGVRVWRIS